jgi:glycosyltransferase involved in cell wall biosynthesis
VAAVLRATGVDHVHAHFATWAAETARQAAALAGLPFSFTVHATDLHRADVDRAALAERVAEAAFVVTVTEHNRQALDDVLRAAGRTGRVHVLPNGVDLARLRPAPRPRPRCVVAVGRLVEKKGFPDLVAALALLRETGRPVPATVIGEGPERSRLEALRDRSGLRDLLDLPGARTHEEVLAAVAGAGVLALPCVVTADGDRDALPTVVLEAMALGTPVVSTDVSGLPEMVEDGRSGRLVPPHDPAALAAAIGELLDDPDRAADLADAARRRVEERFDLRRSVARLHELIAAARP